LEWDLHSTISVYLVAKQPIVILGPYTRIEVKCTQVFHSRFSMPCTGCGSDNSLLSIAIQYAPVWPLTRRKVAMASVGYIARGISARNIASNKRLTAIVKTLQSSGCCVFVQLKKFVNGFHFQFSAL
jgi:hypothetical protein